MHWTGHTSTHARSFVSMHASVMIAMPLIERCPGSGGDDELVAHVDHTRRVPGVVASGTLGQRRADTATEDDDTLLDVDLEIVVLREPVDPQLIDDRRLDLTVRGSVRRLVVPG